MGDFSSSHVWLPDIGETRFLKHDSWRKNPKFSNKHNFHGWRCDTFPIQDVSSLVEAKCRVPSGACWADPLLSGIYWKIVNETWPKSCNLIGESRPHLVMEALVTTTYSSSTFEGNRWAHPRTWNCCRGRERVPDSRQKHHTSWVVTQAFIATPLVIHLENHPFVFPESACEGFFVKKQPLYDIFTSSHLLIPHTCRSTSSHPHTCRSRSSHLHTCRSRSSHLHICWSTSSHLHTCRSTSSHLHICRSTSSHLTSADLHLHTPWHLQI